MASGYGLNGGPSRCFPFWQDVLACYVVNTTSEDDSGKRKCVPILEDYYECLHHKKEAMRTRAIQTAYRISAASTAQDDAPKPKAGEIRNLGLLGKEEDTKAVLGTKSPDLRMHGSFEESSPPEVTSDSKADRLLGRQSSISVYIPSIPGTRFRIQYNILRSETPVSNFYYFKLFMNGANVASWGVDTKTMPSGQVMRGLFEPSSRWNYKDDGILHKNDGVESRHFYFANEVSPRSVATDGGLIEIIVFRATGRKQRVARKEYFRDQERYGIKMPSNGLLEHPKDSQYYEWYLKDPKDKPFVSFSLHYRSWDYLKMLQIIPSSYSRSLLSTSPTPISVRPSIQREDEYKYDDNEDDVTSGSFDSNEDATPWISSSFEGSSEESSENGNEQDPFVDPPGYSETQLTSRIPTSRFLGYEDNQTEGINRSLLRRQTPQIPPHRLSHPHNRRLSCALQPETHSRRSSITPSLISYLERAHTDSPEPFIGTAVAMPVAANCKSPTTSPHKHSSIPHTTSESDVQSEISSTPTAASKKIFTKPRNLFSRARFRREKQLVKEQVSPSKDCIATEHHVGSYMTARPGTKLRHNYRPATPLSIEDSSPSSYINRDSCGPSPVKSTKVWYR
ncbi:hypothetical protein B7463_g12377, partial [Scytalidium lignicola]